LNKYLIKILCMFIPNRDLRHRTREKLLGLNKKIGVSYNVFDGEELLPFSIKSIRGSVNYISVVYQTISNYGNPASHDLKEKLEKMKNDGLIDELYYYTPNLNLTPHQNEIIKRNIGLHLAKKNRCNYFISMDTDEFYDEIEFKNALNYVDKNNIKTSAVSIIEYLGSPENKIIGGYTFTPKDVELYNFYVPFIIKINHLKKQSHGQGYFPCLVDPTRGVADKGKFKLFSVQEIAMHHMSTVRLDLDKKYDNSSLLDSSEEDIILVRKIQQEIISYHFQDGLTLNKGYSLFRNNLVKRVSNKFNIKIPIA